MHDHFLCPCINSFDVQGYKFMHHDIHNSFVSLLPVYSMFLLQVFFCTCLFVDLTLHVLFLSVLKNSKTHKIEKISSKSLIDCVVYITCEFGLVPLYLWHSAFTSLACYVCTYIFVGKILKSMCECCKLIFKLVMNDWSIVLLVLRHAQTCTYISSHAFYVFA